VIFQCLNKKCWFRKSYDKAPNKCPECGSRKYRLIFGEKKKSKDVLFDVTMRDNVRYSDALGVNPEQIPEFKKRFGDLMDFLPDGRCIVRNRHHKKQIMKARGYVELD